MVVEMIFVGTELLLGNIVNTNAQYLSEQCAALGLSVYYQTVVGDNEERLLSVIETARDRSDIVILGGGLGPTEDDLTKETVAKATGRGLVMDEESRARIDAYFANRGVRCPENNWKQAMIPEGSIVLENNNGTAPGIIVEEENCKFILLPGPPNELVPMFEEKVAPYLQSITNEVICSTMVKICGVGESAAEEMILDLIDQQDNPTIATYAKTAEVHLRVTARAENKTEAKALMKPLVKELKNRFGMDVYSTKETRSLEETLIRLLLKNDLKITTAESCTGGLVGSMITGVEGASEIYKMGFITYCDKAKHDLINVKKKTLRQYTAVSEEVAAQMAEGAAKAAEADIALSVTGYAGPGGGTEECPVGTVFVGCYLEGHTEVIRLQLKGNRKKIREQAAIKALDLARRQIIARFGDK